MVLCRFSGDCPRPRPTCLVVETVLPFELTHQFQQAPLLAARDELSKREDDNSFFCTFPADLDGAVQKSGVDGNIFGHV